MSSRLLVFALGMLVGSLAHADIRTVTWVNATQNTNQTPIPTTGAGSLVRTVVEYGTRNAQGGFGTKQGEMFVPAPATTLDLNLVVIQQYALRAFHCNTYATTFAAMADGCSDFSNVALTAVGPPRPGAPSGLTTTNPVAYIIRQSRDTVALVAIGSVPLGTACDTTQPIMGMFVVPKAALIKAQGVTVDPEVVLAACG